MKQLILQCLQPERRLHIKATTQEMFLVSALLYGGLSISALVSLLFPTWSELDTTGVFISALASLLMSVIFYKARAVAPLWLAIIHIPIGISLTSFAIYLGHAEQSIGFGFIYIMGSAYLFHYIAKSIAILLLIFAMSLFAFTLYTLNIEGWPSIVVFTSGNCLLMGLMVWLMTRRLYQLNIKDPLTGLLNRQTIDALTLNLLDKYSTKTENFTLMVIDLNKFKLINDTKGHLEGDRVLKEFSHHLEQCVKDNDFVARWGGDEFVVILNTTDQSDIQQFTDKLRGLTQNTIEFEIGYSSSQKTDTLDTLMQRADYNMYTNKHNRRATDSE